MEWSKNQDRMEKEEDVWKASDPLSFIGDEKKVANEKKKEKQIAWYAQDNDSTNEPPWL